MTTPTIVQSAFGRSASAGSVTVTLSSLPIIGNSLLFVAMGTTSSSTISVNVPAVALATNFNTALGGGIFYTPVNSITQTTIYTLGSFSSTTSVAVFEIQNGRPNVPADQSFYYTVTTTASTTMTTPSLTSPQDSGELRLAAICWDNGAAVSSVPAGWTLLSPTSWYNTANKGAGIWSIPASSAGTYSITFATALDALGAYYADVELAQASTGSIVKPRGESAGAAQNFVGSARSNPVTTVTQKSAFQSVANGFYGTNTYLPQWGVAANGKTISGTILENGLPVAKLVRLINRVTGDYITQTYSSAIDGTFSFASIKPNIAYRVIAFDYPAFNAQILDNITPV